MVGPIFMQVVRYLLLLSCFLMDIDILYIKLKLGIVLSVNLTTAITTKLRVG